MGKVKTSASALFLSGLATAPHPFHCMCMCPRGGVQAVVHCVVNIIHPWKSRQNDSGLVGGFVGLLSKTVIRKEVVSRKEIFSS